MSKTLLNRPVEPRQLTAALKRNMARRKRGKLPAPPLAEDAGLDQATGDNPPPQQMGGAHE